MAGVTLNNAGIEALFLRPDVTDRGVGAGARKLVESIQSKVDNYYGGYVTGIRDDVEYRIVGPNAEVGLVKNHGTTEVRSKAERWVHANRYGTTKGPLNDGMVQAVEEARVA